MRPRKRAKVAKLTRGGVWTQVRQGSARGEPAKFMRMDRLADEIFSLIAT